MRTSKRQSLTAPTESHGFGRASDAVVAVGVIALTLLFAMPASAKSSDLVTVSGPGIDREVSLETAGVTFGTRSYSPPPMGHLRGGQIANRPSDLGERFVVTWYATLGSMRHNQPPTPMVERVALYLDMSGSVAYVELAGYGEEGVNGWFSVNPAYESDWDTAISRLQESDVVGSAGFEFIAEGTGRGAVTSWEPTLPDNNNVNASPLSGIAVSLLAVGLLVILLSASGKFRRSASGIKT